MNDVDTVAEDRLDEYNLAYLPTVFFDGGSEVVVGGYSDLEYGIALYESMITQSGTRPVPDIDLTVTLEWLGSATVRVIVSVRNNEVSAYDGHLHTYVTEKVSKRGWRDSHNQPYEFAFLDYAFNGDISIPAGDSLVDTTDWVGANYEDGYGNDFGNLAQQDVMVIAVAFDSDWHQEYSDPPDNEYPFSAYYVDETAAASFNGPPAAPSNPSPVDVATGIHVDTDMTWIGGDYDPHDTVTYNVYFGTTIGPPLVATGESLAVYDPGTLDYGMTYFWRVVAFDNHGDSTTSGALPWKFTTNSLPLVPADPVPADSATDVSVDTVLNWTGGDPDPGDTVRYHVYFGTEANPPLVVSFLPASTYDPGPTYYDTTYYWRVVAVDETADTASSPIWSYHTEELQWVCGDANGDDNVTVADAIYVKNYIYGGGSAPVGSGDVNLDGNVTIADGIYIVGYIYGGGPPPCEPF